MANVPKRVVMRSRNKLGDALTVLTGLEHYCVVHEPQTIVTVCASDLYRDIMDLFQFPHLRYDPSDRDAECLDDMLFTFCLFGEMHDYWPNKFYTCLCCHLKKPVHLDKHPLEMPKSKIGSWTGGNGIAYVQLDARACGRLQLTESEMNRMIELASFGKSVAVLGGPDTVQYLGTDVPYVLGDVKTIANRLLECDHLIAADSGIAHLAGYLGVPVYLTNTIRFEQVFIFYRHYPTVRFIDRGFLS